MFESLHSRYARKLRVARPPLRFEALERRDMLTTGARVVAVEVASTSWSPEFVRNLSDNDLGTSGYAIPLGSTAQSDTLPWKSLNEIRIKFDCDFGVTSADLSVSGTNHKVYLFQSFHYDPPTQWATWTLSTPITSDRVQLDLNSHGTQPALNYYWTALDGEWINNVSTKSGDGTAGGDFEFILNVQVADVNKSGNVSSADYDQIFQRAGSSTATAGYSPKYDVDGNGLIDSNDAQVAIDHFFESLPTGSPAGVGNDAPTTSGFVLVHLSNTSPNATIALTNGFNDVEDGASGLSYSIVSDNNPWLFTNATIDNVTHQLVVNAVIGASGRATFDVRHHRFGWSCGRREYNDRFKSQRFCPSNH